MKIFVFLKSILLLTVVSTQVVADKTRAGLTLEPLLGTEYHEFSSVIETREGISVSCVSSIAYVLTIMGKECTFPDFRIMRDYLSPISTQLSLNRTKHSKEGLIIFNNFHFTVISRDFNNNGVVDKDDLIIHALFKPLREEPLNNWLSVAKDKNFKVLDFNQINDCP